MVKSRFYIKAPLEPKQTIELTGKELHHLKHVMRIHVGDAIELVNGSGVLAFGSVISIAKSKAEVKIDTKEESPPPSPQMILAQAMPQKNHLDFVLEKGTELGVDEFWLFGTHKSKPMIDPAQTPRLEQILIAALKQCGRLHLPRIQSFEGLHQLPSPPEHRFFASFEGAPFSSALPSKGTSLYLVGPESGWTEEESDWLKNEYGAKPVSLGPYILRSETAAMAGAALLRAFQS